MNKRGQIYILAAIVLIVAVWGVVKVVNKVESPDKLDNFDFYVENFVGERAYVMDFGYLQGGDPTEQFSGEGGLLDIFAREGFDVGLVMIIYDDKQVQDAQGNQDIQGRPWKVINLLKSQVITGCSGCDEDDEEVLPSGQEGAGGLSFSLTDEGREFFIDEKSLIEFPNGCKYYVAEFENIPEIYVDVEGNRYHFKKESGKPKRIESIIFKNLNDDYVKVVRV